MPETSRPRTDPRTSEKVMEEVRVESERMVILTDGWLNEKVIKVTPAASSTTRSRKGTEKEKGVIDRVLLPQNPDHRDEMATVGQLPLQANSRKSPEREVHEPVLRLLASSRMCQAQDAGGLQIRRQVRVSSPTPNQKRKKRFEIRYSKNCFDTQC